MGSNNARSAVAIRSKIIMACRALMCASAFLLTIPAMAMADSARFNIAAQPLPQALKAFADQAHMQVLYQYDAVAGATGNAVSGTLEKRDALERLLKNTGLEAIYSSGSAVTIRPTRANTTSQEAARPTQNSPTQESDKEKSPADRFRVAQVDQGKAPSTSSVEEQKHQKSTKERETLQEVVITGRYEFLSADTSGTTNLPIPIEQVPQTISLVSSDFIKAADLKTLGQIAEYTPGALNIGNPEGLQTQIKLRGFPAGQTIDGINQTPGSYEPDYAIFDRLEVVQGPSSVVYGISYPGGLVNFVTKSATSETPDYLYAQVGSWRNARVEGQVAGALDAAGNVRVIGIVVQDQGDSFTDFVYHKKTTVYGGINFNLAGSVTGYLHGGYERYERPTFDGIPTEADGSPAPVPRSFCICAEGIGVTTSVFHSEGDLTWHATDHLDLSLKGNYQHANSYGTEDYAYGLAANGDLGLSLNTYRYLVENYGIGASSIYHLDGLGLKDSFLSSAVLYQSARTTYKSLFPSSNPTANIFGGDGAISQALNAYLPQAVNPFDYTTYLGELTVSGQAWLKPIDPLAVLLGVSYTKPRDETGGAVASNGVYQSFSVGGRISYRAGLTYEFLPKTFAYVSYSQSFIPQSPELSVSGGVIVTPLQGEQYEAGLKFRSADGRLFLTGALFELRERNLEEFAGASTLTGGTYFQNAGQLTHKGVEFQALGKVTPQWQINAGYAFLDPRITGATAVQAATIGQTELYLPKNTVSLYTTYALANGALRGLSFGGGIRYVGSEHTSFDNLLANAQYFQAPTPITKDIPSYTLVDLNLSYAVDQWLMQINAHSLFNRTYFINNYQTLFFGNMPGDPFNIAFSVRRTF
jgi:outer membrane receptor for ferric coprogen and ferric-rhodotorulic acid